ncbi:MAG: pilus assembly PilX N-terminal domain-containing protein [Candidatus Moranbacteria bacterium]|nr:pilus assembly PilX N-terminal domain-containing protein [Candidatus Moranbacteria bacterium]
MKNKNKFTKKGSVLVFTLFIMFIALIITMGIAVSSVIETKSVLSTKNSSAAFQVADSGIEAVSAKLKELYVDPLVGASSTIDDVCDNTGLLSDCVSGRCVGDGMEFELYFYDINRDELGCSDLIDDIDIVKSAGTYQGTIRAVEIDLQN